MDNHKRFNAALGRIATTTNVLRTRAEDAERAAHNGDREHRLSLVVDRLEHIAEELEKAA
jgi:hypothetical protein